MLLLQGQNGGSGWATLIMFGGMFVIMYFFMIRPQQKKQKEAKKFQDSLEVGDKVMTLREHKGPLHSEGQLCRSVFPFEEGGSREPPCHSSELFCGGFYLFS